MVELTQSLSQWLFDNHRDILPLIMMGHLELFTHEMQKAYLEWCTTEDGKKYLAGGLYYKEATHTKKQTAVRSFITEKQ